MAKVLLDANDKNRVLQNSNDDVFGTTGVDSVIIEAGKTAIMVEQDIEQVSFKGNVNQFSFQQAGNNLKVYSLDGKTLISTVLVQADGTDLTFSDGTVAAKFDTTGATPLLVVGGKAITTGSAQMLVPTTIDTAVTTATTSAVDGQMFNLTQAKTIAGEKYLAWDGVNANQVLDFLERVVGLDLYELDLVKADGSANLSSIQNIALTDANATADRTLNITTNSASGSASVGAEYVNFVQSLILNINNSRLTVNNDTPAADVATTLTTQMNNGGTVEAGYTTAGDDIIIAGRPDYIHAAYIDGGAGYDTLKIEMKGPFAQPVLLKSIEQINVSNASHVYDPVKMYDTNAITGYPKLDDAIQANAANESALDLTNAIDLKKLVLTEQYDMLGVDAGKLVINGIQNNATARLEGMFENTQKIQLHYAEGAGVNKATGVYEGINVELQLGSTNALDLDVTGNASIVNIKAEGFENVLNSTSFDQLRVLNVSGAGSLYVEKALTGFKTDRPAVIDAHTNTGGVELTIGNIDTPAVAAIDAVVSVAEVKDTYGNITTAYVAPVPRVEAIDAVVGTVLSEVIYKGSAGNDDITVINADKVTITAGNGTNNYVVDVNGSLSFTGGTGTDTVTVKGDDNGVKLNVSNAEVVNLGTADGTVNDAVIALEGSSISGTAVVINVAENADLTSADLSGVSAIKVADAVDVVLTDTQINTLTHAGATISAAHTAAVANPATAGTVTVEVTADATLSSLVDLTKIDPSVKLIFNISGENTTLTLSAEELTKYVAEDGIKVDGTADGKVVITNAATTFDAFAADTGGSINNDADNDDDDNDDADNDDVDNDAADNDDVDNDDVDNDVTVLRTVGGYNRPSATTLAQELDVTANNQTAKSFDNTNITEVKYVGTDVAPIRLNVEMEANGGIGAAGNQNGLKSTGVNSFVVTKIGTTDAADSADIYVCDNTVGLQTLGLKGAVNSNNIIENADHSDTIRFHQVNHGVNFLLEGDGSVDYPQKQVGDPNYSNIGNLKAEYFWQDADAIVNVNNAGTTLTTRAINVDGIEISNAKTITVNVADGNAVIGDINNDVTGLDVNNNQVETITFNSAKDVTLQGHIANANLKTLNAAGVAGTFALDFNDNADSNYSGVALTGVEKVVFSDDAMNAGTQGTADVTFTAAQIKAIGEANFSATIKDADITGGSNLIVTKLDGAAAYDLGAIDAKDGIALGAVSISDTGTVVTLDAGTTLTGADSLDIVAKASDTTLVLTAAQLGQVADLDPNAIAPIVTATGATKAAGITITDLGASEHITLDAVNDAINVTFRVNGVTANADVAATAAVNEQFQLLETGADAAVLEVTGGTNDLSKGDIDAVSDVLFSANGTLTLTAAQVLDIGTDKIKAAAGVTNAVLNITDFNVATAIDLQQIKDAGVNIGDITISKEAVLTLDANTTLGGAARILMPLSNDATPANTSLTLSAVQFKQFSGVIVEQDLIAANNNHADVHITDLTNAQNDINLAQVAVTGLRDLTVSQAVLGADKLGGTDVTLAAAANLGTFTVILDDLVDVVNAAGGQTIRFTSAAQADRAITVTSPDVALAEHDINVVWAFTDMTGVAAGKINTHNYDANIGRLWVNDALLTLVNGKLEDLFTSPADVTYLDPNHVPAGLDNVNLNGQIIVHVVNDVLSNLVPDSLGITRTVEYEAFKALGDVVIAETDPLVHINNVVLSLGGEVKLGNVMLDNTLLAAAHVGSDPFGTLTINSYEAGAAKYQHYLPENFVVATNRYPGDYLDASNTNVEAYNEVGDITSGSVNAAADQRHELTTVTVNAPADGEKLKIGTVYFESETANSAATFNSTTDQNVIVKSLNTVDTDITSLTINNTGAATLSIIGASPALNLGATTETVTINGTGTVLLGTAADAAKPGVSGTVLSTINAAGYAGKLDLGTLAVIDGTDDPAIADDPATLLVNEFFAGNTAFTFTAGTGETDLVVSANTLAAGSTWNFNMSNLATSSIVFTDSSIFSAGKTVNVTNNASVVTVQDVAIDTQAEVQTLLNLGYVDVIDLTANGAVTINATTAVAAAGIFSTNGTVTVSDTGTAIRAALDQIMVNNPTWTAADFAANAHFDVIDATDNALGLSAQQLIGSAAMLQATDVITLSDTGANIAALTVAQLSSANIDVIDATDNVIALTLAQEAAVDAKLVTTGFTADTITIADTGANIAALTVAQFQNAKISTFDATDNAITLNVAQEIAADAKLVVGDVITVVDTGVAIGAMTAAQLDSAKIDAIDASDNAITMTVAQLNNANNKLATGTNNDTITVSDTGVNIATLAANIADDNQGTKGLDNNVINHDIIDATDNIITLTAAQALNFDSLLVMSDAITVADSAANIAVMTVQLLASPKLNVIDVVNNLETFTLTLNAGLTVNGATDTIAFNGTTVALADAATAATVGIALAAASYTDWTATANGAVVTFTAKTPNNKGDVVIGDFTFTDNLAANVTFGGAVAVTNQGTTLALTATQEIAADAKLFANDLAVVSDSGAEIALMTAAQIGSAKIDTVWANDANITLTVAQELAADAKLTTGNTLTVQDTTANLNANLAALLASTKVDALVATDGFTPTAAEFTPQYEAARLLTDFVTITDTGLAIGAMTAAQLGSAKIDTIDATDNGITFTTAQEIAADAKLMSADNIYVNDTAANIQTNLVALFASNKVDFINASDNFLNVSAAQGASAANAVKLDVVDVITAVDTTVNINANLVALLANNKIDVIDSSENAVAINITVAQEAVAANMAKLVAGDTVNVLDTTANITAAMAALMGDGTVDTISFSGAAASLTFAQENTLAAKLVTTDVITVADTSATINANLVALLADGKVDKIDSTENAVTLQVTMAQVGVAANLNKLVAGDLVTATDGTLANILGLNLGANVVDHITVGDAAFIDGGGVGAVQGGANAIVDAVGEWSVAANVFTYYDGAVAQTVTVVGATSFTALGTDLLIV